MWEEYNSSTNKVTTKAKTIDSSANTVASATLSVRLSDCQPVMCSDGTVKWYVSDNSSPKLYSINPYDLTKRHEHTYTSVVTKQPTCKATGVRTYTCTTCGAKKTETIKKLAHSYKQYVTPATTSADGSITKKCTACGYSSSKSKIYKITSVSLSSTVFTYSGNNITPSVTVKNSKNNKLVKGKDYKVIYPTNSVNVGRYSVKIQFIGNYSGAVNKYFDIVPIITSLTNTSGGIKLSWNKVDGAYGYRLYYKTSSGGWKRFKDTTATSFTDSGVSPNRTETYTIRCIDKNGKTVSGFYSKGWSKKYTPVAPTISKLENTSSGIKLNWNKITGVYGYRLYQKTSNGWKRIKDTTATSFTDSAVSANQTKTYTIRCIDKNGKTVSGFYSKGWSKKYTAAPTISKLENTSSGIKLSWNKVTGVYGYRVYQKTSTGWKRIKDTTATSYTDSAVSANQTKTYTIRCIDKNGKTVSGFNSKGWSKKYTAATPKITKLTNRSKGVSVTWNKIAGVYGYRLYRKYDGGSWTKVKDTTSTSFTDSGAKKGKKVTYTVRCIDRKGKTVSGFNSKGWSITRK